MPDDEKPSRRTTPRKPAARKPATRKPAPRKPATPEPEDVGFDDVADEPATSRPVAVGGAAVTWEPEDAPEDVGDEGHAVEVSVPAAGLPEDDDAPSEVERPLYEIATGVVAALLAASVFGTWYRLGSFEATGWGSGTWGPVVVGLAVLAVVVVALRQLKIPVRFPVEASLLLEGVGWVSVAAVLIKRNFAPRINTTEMAPTGWIIASLILAVGVATLGGMTSRNAPLVLRPDWLRGRAGRLGAAMMVAAILGGVAFGFVNSVETGLPPQSSSLPQQESGFPKCASDAGITVPKGIKPIQGQELASANLCIASMETTLAPKKAVNRFRDQLKGEGWKVAFRDFSTDVPRMQFGKGDRCATVTANRSFQSKKKAAVTLLLAPPQSIGGAPPSCNLGEKDRISKGNGG